MVLLRLFKFLFKITILSIFTFSFIFVVYSSMYLNAIQDIYFNKKYCRVQNQLATILTEGKEKIIIAGELYNGVGHIIGVVDGKIIDKTYNPNKDFFKWAIKQKIIKFNGEEGSIYYLVPCGVILNNKSYGFC